MQSRRPFPQWGTITYPVFDENGDFNALQAKYQVRAWRDLNLLALLSHGKCIDYGSGEGGTTVTLLHSYRAVCDYDQTNVFSGSFHYLLPFGKGKAFFNAAHGFVNQADQRMAIRGYRDLRSGFPITPVWGTDVANTGVGSQRPELVAPPSIVGNVACWYYVAVNHCVQADPGGTTAFVTPAQYTYGDRAAISCAPTLKQANFSVQRTFYITERYRAQFRGELFNALNHPTFGAPSTTVTASSGGQISSTVNAARVVQMALKLYF